MSNARRLIGGLIALPLCVLTLAVARAHADPNPFEAWARFVSERREYRGRYLPFPESTPRPRAQGLTLCSERAPLCVQADSTVTPTHTEKVLVQLEDAYDWLRDRGFPLPYPDGGYGGTAAFDLYLAPNPTRGASGAVDVPIEWAEFDAATTFALLDSALPKESLARCTLVALTEAALLGQDPAEEEGTRRAFASYVSFLAHGEFGCEPAITDAQHAPELGPLGAREEQIASAALWLLFLSERHDAGSGRFLSNLWDIARQKSEAPDRLHATPTFWQALGVALQKSGESRNSTAAELAIARYLAGYAQGPLPGLAKVPVIDTKPFAKLPVHLSSEEPLATYGSAYARVDTRGAADGARLHIWLRGEPFAEWSLSAVRLDALGHELGRVMAPVRRVPESFIPLELTKDTAQVLVVVTKLPAATQKTRPAAENDRHAFRLILGRADQ